MPHDRFGEKSDKSSEDVKDPRDSSEPASPAAKSFSPPPPAAPLPHKLTFWQHLWNGSWGGLGWLLMAIAGIFILIYAYFLFLA